MHRHSAVSKALFGKFKITDQKYWFWILKITEFFSKYKLLGQTNTQRSNNFESQKIWKCNQLWELGLTLVAYKKVYCKLGQVSLQSGAVHASYVAWALTKNVYLPKKLCALWRSFHHIIITYNPTIKLCFLVSLCF